MVSPRMSTRQKRADRVELMQGTLDMLVLRTLRPGATHGQAIAKAIERNSDDVLQVEQDRSIRPCTGFSSAGGSLTRKAPPRTTGAPTSTA